MGATSKAAPPKHSRGGSSGYQPVHQDDAPGSDAEDDAAPGAGPLPPPGSFRSRHDRRLPIIILTVCLVILVASNLYLSLPYFFPGPGPGSDSCAPKHVPQYFQTSPELWPGPTATGAAAFMAQTRVIDPTATYVPNEPLQTSIPIDGMQQGNQSIFKMMGYLSPYTPSPGFGVDEYPLPPGAEIIQVQMLSRHGARYPTTGADVAQLGEKIANLTDDFDPKGALRFLKNWKYQLGAEILVPKGREELFQSGTAYPQHTTDRPC